MNNRPSTGRPYIPRSLHRRNISNTNNNNHSNRQPSHIEPVTVHLFRCYLRILTVINTASRDISQHLSLLFDPSGELDPAPPSPPPHRRPPPLRQYIPRNLLTNRYPGNLPLGIYHTFRSRALNESSSDSENSSLSEDSYSPHSYARSIENPVDEGSEFYHLGRSCQERNLLH